MIPLPEPVELTAGITVAKLRAKAALHGLVLHEIVSTSDAPAFIVARANASQEFEGLDAVAAELGRWSGR